MAQMRSIALLAGLLAASSCLAEWEIVSVTTASFARESYKGPPEVRMKISIRNTSDRDVFVYGQTLAPGHHFYLVESFVQNVDNAVWERQNIGMCDSVGKTGWIAVKPGQVIEQERVVFRSYVGRSMILTFRRAYVENDGKGTEVLLGPLKVPEPTE